MSTAPSDFVIIGAARSGSTLLVDLLNCSDDIKCLYEIFHPNLLQVDGVDRTELLELRSSDPDRFLRTLRAEANEKSFGFKIFEGHDDAFLAELIADEAVKKIVVHRSNALAVYSSKRISAAKQLWAETGEQTSVGAQQTGAWEDQVSFDEDGLLRVMREQQSFYGSVVEKLNDSGQPFVFIEYEQLLNEQLVRRLFSFLGAAQPASLTTGLLRNNRADVINRFTNPDDVVASLENIGRLGWLHEANGAWNV